MNKKLFSGRPIQYFSLTFQSGFKKKNLYFILRKLSKIWLPSNSKKMLKSLHFLPSPIRIVGRACLGGCTWTQKWKGWKFQTPKISTWLQVRWLRAAGSKNRNKQKPVGVPSVSFARLQLTLPVFVVDSDGHKTVSAVQSVLNLLWSFQISRWIYVYSDLGYSDFLSAELSVNFRNQIYKCMWLLQSSKILEAFFLSGMLCWFWS